MGRTPDRILSAARIVLNVSKRRAAVAAGAIGPIPKGPTAATIAHHIVQKAFGEQPGFVDGGEGRKDVLFSGGSLGIKCSRENDWQGHGADGGWFLLVEVDERYSPIVGYLVYLRTLDWELSRSSKRSPYFRLTREAKEKVSRSTRITV